MSTETPTEYDPFDDTLPTVQIPLGADRPGLSIDGEFTRLWDLPPTARDLYNRYASQGGQIRIWQCGSCGYLTDAKALKVTTYNQAYECGYCGERLRGTTQHGGSRNYTQVHGPTIDVDDPRRVDVLAVVTGAECEAGHNAYERTVTHTFDSGSTWTTTEINQSAVECPQCVPNHPSHLGRLQNQVEGAVTQTELLAGVAEAVAEQRREQSDTHSTWSP